MNTAPHMAPGLAFVQLLPVPPGEVSGGLELLRWAVFSSHGLLHILLEVLISSLSFSEIMSFLVMLSLVASVHPSVFSI
mgnify:CR=1 FL=1